METRDLLGVHGDQPFREWRSPSDLFVLSVGLRVGAARAQNVMASTLCTAIIPSQNMLQVH